MNGSNVLNSIVLKMLQSAYYDMENSNEHSVIDPSSVTTPFSVKDILNIADGSEQYMAYHTER